MRTVVRKTSFHALKVRTIHHRELHFPHIKMRHGSHFQPQNEVLGDTFRFFTWMWLPDDDDDDDYGFDFTREKEKLTLWKKLWSFL